RVGSASSRPLAVSDPPHPQHLPVGHRKEIPMWRVAIFAVIGCPVLALCLAAAGCGTRETPEESKPVRRPPVEIKKTPLEVTPDGVLRGKVVYDGEPPPPE